MGVIGWGRRWETRGIQVRLLGLVMIPIVGFVAVGGQQILEHRRVAAHADELAAGVDDATAALEAFVTLVREFRATETMTQARAFGVSPDAVAEQLGYDMAGELSAARAAVDANPLVPELLPGRDLAAALEAERDRVDGGGQQDLLRRLFPAAEDRWIEATRRLAPRGGGTPIANDVQRAIEALRSSAEVFQAANDRILVVAELIVPGVAEGILPAADLGAVQARYDGAMAEVLDVADEHLTSAVRRVRASDEFESALVDLPTDPGPASDVDALGERFRMGLEHDELVQALVARASDDARAHAVAAGRAAQGAYRSTVVALVGLFLLSIAVALAVARSIAAPLRRLVTRAHEVSGGELDGPALPLTGPPEVAMVAAALNDAVDNLRIVEQRMGALATGDLGDAGRRAPGRLGDLVGRSVDGLARSLAERDALQQRLAHEASHDPLTGLANRRQAMVELQAMLSRGEQVAVVFLDLDGFKAVNDELGHAAGDQVLTMAARRLRRTTREGSAVARFGGDEFVVATTVRSEREALVLADRIIDAFHSPLTLDAMPRQIAASVGVAVSIPGDDADTVLRAADAALYVAKQSGRGRAVVVDSALRSELEAEHQLELDLRAALVDDELGLQYQPVFFLDGGLRGVEALLRWQRGVDTVCPDAFVPLAERTGMIVDVDRWVLRHGLGQLARWRTGELPDITLSINVSAQTLLSRSFVPEVAAALAATGVDPTALIVEVTETALLQDLERAARHIGELRELGVRTSVDDFGTGYTSVSHLRGLPVSEVKIDRSFIDAMESDARDRTLVELIARIGVALDLDVVAEGVETEEQLSTVRQMGCHFAQGHLLGRPMSPEQLELAHGAPEGAGTR